MQVRLHGGKVRKTLQRLRQKKHIKKRKPDPRMDSAMENLLRKQEKIASEKRSND